MGFIRNILPIANQFIPQIPGTALKLYLLSWFTEFLIQLYPKDQKHKIEKGKIIIAIYEYRNQIFRKPWILKSLATKKKSGSRQTWRMVELPCGSPWGSIPRISSSSHSYSTVCVLFLPFYNFTSPLLPLFISSCSFLSCCLFPALNIEI